MHMRILLDTNFLIDSVRFKINLDDISGLVGSYKLATISTVIDELKRISNYKFKDNTYAKLALKLIEENKMELIESDRRPDEAFLMLAKKESFIVATNDAQLRKKLNASGVKTIYLKSKKHLAIDST